MRAIVALAPLTLVLAIAACAKPEPPQITPESAQVTAVTPTGFNLLAQLDAFNPNKVDLSIQSVEAKVTLNHTIAAGDVTSSTAFTMPAGQHTKVPVPLTMQWTDLPAIAMLAASPGDIPFDIEGTVAVGGELLHANVPFHLSGSMTHQQLVEATRRSLPAGLFR